jgi:hypothetical protein
MPMADSTLPAGDAAPKDTEAPAPAAPAPASGPVDTQAKADAPKAKEPGPAAKRWAEYQERKAAKAAEREAAKATASNIDLAILDRAKRWEAHEAAESKRISEAAAGLDAEDRALIDGEKDLGRKATLLARLQKAAAPEPKGPRPVAKAGPSGSPPSVVDLDLVEALKTPEGFAAAKSAPGFKEKFSAMLNGNARKSTLDVAREAGRK